MKRVLVPSYPVSIFIAAACIFEAETICRDYCDDVGFCVTVTETVYCFTGGEQSGVIVGLINYPRFPKEPADIWEHAETLAAQLCERLKQDSYTIQGSQNEPGYAQERDRRGRTLPQAGQGNSRADKAREDVG